MVAQAHQPCGATVPHPRGCRLQRGHGMRQQTQLVLVLVDPAGIAQAQHQRVHIGLAAQHSQHSRLHRVGAEGGQRVEHGAGFGVEHGERSRAGARGQARLFDPDRRPRRRAACELLGVAAQGMATLERFAETGAGQRSATQLLEQGHRVAGGQPTQRDRRGFALQRRHAGGHQNGAVGRDVAQLLDRPVVQRSIVRQQQHAFGSQPRAQLDPRRSAARIDAVERVEQRLQQVEAAQHAVRDAHHAVAKERFGLCAGVAQQPGLAAAGLPRDLDRRHARVQRTQDDAGDFFAVQKAGRRLRLAAMSRAALGHLAAGERNVHPLGVAGQQHAALVLDAEMVGAFDVGAGGSNALHEIPPGNPCALRARPGWSHSLCFRATVVRKFPLNNEVRARVMWPVCRSAS